MIQKCLAKPVMVVRGRSDTVGAWGRGRQCDAASESESWVGLFASAPGQKAQKFLLKRIGRPQSRKVIVEHEKLEKVLGLDTKSLGPGDRPRKRSQKHVKGRTNLGLDRKQRSAVSVVMFDLGKKIVCGRRRRRHPVKGNGGCCDGADAWRGRP